MSQSLPSHPNLDQLKRQAKELLRLFRGGDAGARRRVEIALERAVDGLSLADAQCAVARQYGFASWSRLKRHVEENANEPVLAADMVRFERRVRDLVQHHAEGRPYALRFFAQEESAAQGAPSAARTRDLVAHEQGFAGWSELERNVAAFAEGRGDAVAAGLAAVRAGDIDRLEELMRQDALLARVEIEGGTLLHHAAHLGRGEDAAGRGAPSFRLAVLQVLLRFGDPDPVDRDHALLTASSFDDADAAETLLAAGARVNGPQDDSVNLAFALRFRHQRAAAALVRHGARLDLRLAAGLGRLDLLPSFFADSGVPNDDAGGLHRPFVEPRPANSPDETLHQALAYACINDRADAAAYLLDRGAEIDDAGPGFDVVRTPLHWAAIYGSRAAADVLLDRGADVGARDPDHGATPIDHAHYEGHAALRDRIVDRAGGIHDAVFWGRTGRVEALVAADSAQVNARRQTDGAAPLHQAVRAGRADAVAFLLERGADPGLKDKEGRTAAAVAREEGRDEIVALLPAEDREGPGD